jgi:A/G-specific adenine glycosylase
MKSKPFSKSEIESVQNILLSWFDRHQRDLPWRTNYDPYQVWIAEIMGQQTQMDRVVQYFNRWIERFPNIDAVAAAPAQQILKTWEGLGYYSRAKNIHRTAKQLKEKYDSRIPADLKSLLALPGIGPYTAAAILSIAYNIPCSLVDANVERFFSRLLDLKQPVKQAPVPARLRALADDLLPANQARLFNQALMEFGALVCRPKSPDCPSCPLADHCRARLRGTVDKRPVVEGRKKKVEIIMACAIITHQEKIYIQQRLPDDVWGSLWEFPGGKLQVAETPAQAACREVFEETEMLITNLRPFATVVHHYTKYRVTLYSFSCRLQGNDSVPILHAASQYRWVSLSGLADFPFPAGHRQLVRRLQLQK